MKELSKEELHDILYGCTVLGTGGGGDLTNGLRLVDSALAEGKRFRLAGLDEIPDDGFIGVPYICGALTKGKKEPALPVLKEPLGVLATKVMERYLGRTFDGVISTELGGENTAQAFYTAALLDKVIVDADPAGRSVPELQHSTFFLNDIPIAPLAVADAYGNSAVLDQVTSDKRAEDWVRALAVVSDNSVGVLDHPAPAKILRGAVIPGAVSYAGKIGATLRRTRMSGGDPAQGIVAAVGGKVVFRGIVKTAEYESREGFTYGTVVLNGQSEYSGHVYKIWYKNENIISWLDDAVHATVPDLICLIDEAGNPQINPLITEGTRLTAFVLPAPAEWTTQRGLACFGPRYFGFDFDYKSLL
jgi:DUF917 family protein